MVEWGGGDIKNLSMKSDKAKEIESINAIITLVKNGILSVNRGDPESQITVRVYQRLVEKYGDHLYPFTDNDETVSEIKTLDLKCLDENKFKKRVEELFSNNIGKNINAQGGRRLKKIEVMSILHGCIHKVFDEYKNGWSVE